MNRADEIDHELRSLNRHTEMLALMRDHVRTLPRHYRELALDADEADLAKDLREIDTELARVEERTRELLIEAAADDDL
jgi:hypothetical protein